MGRLEFTYTDIEYDFNIFHYSSLYNCNASAGGLHV